MIEVNKFKPGITFSDGKEIFVVLSAQHSKQGRGQANVKAKVKNLRTGATLIKSYTGGDKVSPAHIEKRKSSYLYNDGSNIIIMDQENFTQTEIPLEKVTWELNFLTEGSEIMTRSFEGEVLDLELNAKVNLVVTSAPDATKGNTTTNPQKRITLETGYQLDAPMFIKDKDVIIVSTETGKYLGKA